MVGGTQRVSIKRAGGMPPSGRNLVMPEEKGLYMPHLGSHSLARRSASLQRKCKQQLLQPRATFPPLPLLSTLRGPLPVGPAFPGPRPLAKLRRMPYALPYRCTARAASDATCTARSCGARATPTCTRWRAASRTTCGTRAGTTGRARCSCSTRGWPSPPATQVRVAHTPRTHPKHTRHTHALGTASPCVRCKYLAMRPVTGLLRNPRPAATCYVNSPTACIPASCPALSIPRSNRTSNPYLLPARRPLAPSHPCAPRSLARSPSRSAPPLATYTKTPGSDAAAAAAAAGSSPDEAGGLPAAVPCSLCGSPDSQLPHVNCANVDCNELFIACAACKARFSGCCCEACMAAPRLLRPAKVEGGHYGTCCSAGWVCYGGVVVVGCGLPRRCGPPTWRAGTMVGVCWSACEPDSFHRCSLPPQALPAPLFRARVGNWSWQAVCAAVHSAWCTHHAGARGNGPFVRRVRVAPRTSLCRLQSC